MRGENWKTYSFQIPLELLEKLREMARQECRSTAGMLRVLIKKEVEQFEKSQK